MNNQVCSKNAHTEKINNESNKIIIYSSPKGVEIKLEIKDDTIWMTQMQIAELFGVNIPAVNKHLNNIFSSLELDNRVISKMEITAADGKVYNTKTYNLDAIISVGYRVNSKKATQFRVWATTTLRKYLIDGFALNKKRLAQQEQKLLNIQKTIELIRGKSEVRELKGHEKELLDIISAYTKSLVLLDKFDDNTLTIGKVNKYVKYELNFEDYSRLVSSIRKNYQGVLSTLFGVEIGDKIKSIIGSINQTFDGRDLYQSIEEKAAHLLYFVIKDHPFSDGNKRIASLLFIYFLNKNSYLYKVSGERKINDNALVALALLIAVSQPREKESIIKLIVSIIQEKLD